MVKSIYGVVTPAISHWHLNIAIIIAQICQQMPTNITQRKTHTLHVAVFSWLPTTKCRLIMCKNECVSHVFTWDVSVIPTSGSRGSVLETFKDDRRVPPHHQQPPPTTPPPPLESWSHLARCLWCLASCHCSIVSTPADLICSSKCPCWPFPTWSCWFDLTFCPSAFLGGKLLKGL